MLLCMQQVSKDFGEGPLIDGATLSLDRGESVAVMAPSGAGKSTLLSMAGLLLSPTAGSVLLDGEDMTAASDDARSRARAEKIGFLFQHTQLVGTLRAWENAAVQADFAPKGSRSMSDAAVKDRAMELLATFGLAHRAMHYPHQLSIGQKRRIACVRALFLSPALIIADEPTNDLDEANAKVVIDALFAPVARGEAGLLVATHDERLAAGVDRVVDVNGHIL